jgi:putative ATP-binding cassette transporter
VLDEATSALDPASQDQMMELLTRELGATTIVSVAHRPELEVFHSRKITLERRPGGARLMGDIHLTRKLRRSPLIKRWLRPLRRAAPKAARRKTDQKRA